MESIQPLLKQHTLPDIILAHPIDLDIPMSLEVCAGRLNHSPASGLHVYLTPVSQTSTRFYITKRISRFFYVEAAGYLIRRQPNTTIVVGQARISVITYGLTLLLALLAVLFMQAIPALALLFALLFLRMVMAMVVSGRICKAELAHYLERKLTIY